MTTHILVYFQGFFTCCFVAIKFPLLVRPLTWKPPTTYELQHHNEKRTKVYTDRVKTNQLKLMIHIHASPDLSGWVDFWHSTRWDNWVWVELESRWKTGLSLKVFKVRSMRFAINSLWFEDFFKPLAASSITTRPKKFKKCDLSYLEHDHYVAMTKLPC